MKLFFRHFGEGKPVVILHGLFGLSDNWVTFGKQLGEGYSVYIPDLRNHGRSPHSAVFGFPSLAGDLSEFLEDRGLEEVMLIGHSLGGKTAMWFTFHNPSMVSKLVVVDISMRKSPPDREHQQLLNAMISVEFSRAGSRTDVEEQLKASVGSARLRQFLMKNVYRRDRRSMDWRLNLKVLNDNLLNIGEGIVEQGIFNRPVLFVRGGKSDYILETDLPDIKMKFPRAVVKTIGNASHWVHADAPGEFFSIVKTFLDE